MGKYGEEFRPRVIRARLKPRTVQTVRERWRHDEPNLDRAGCLGGAGLALAQSLAAARASCHPGPLTVAVGEAVRGGLPTADRATVAGISPLTGLFVDGQIGGRLARRLARVCDALCLEGHTELLGAVLVIGAEGELRLASHPALLEAQLPARGDFLRSVYGDSEGSLGGLVVGPAADQGVGYACLANLSSPPSFSGRGGLGLRFRELGLVALVVTCQPVAASSKAEALRASLARSPRLAARGLGGTLEMLGAFAAVGDLGSPAAGKLSPAAARELEAAAARQTLERLACAGCPTACRHIVMRASQTDGKGRQGARFSSVAALGASLQLESFDDALELLATCGEVGVDAREAGALLALLATARQAGRAPGPPLFGSASACAAELRALGDAGRDTLLSRSARDLAHETGLTDHLREARGLAVREVSSLAGLLGQWVSARGADPMRSFPFLAESGGDSARLAELFAPVDLPPGSFDPRDPAGKGRLVWWHENLATMIDVSGFCAFSAAGLVSDGVFGLDDLAALLAPRCLPSGGREWLAAGALLVLLQRELLALLGVPGPAEEAPWLAPFLELPGMYDEYALLRGLDQNSAVSEEALARMGQAALLDVGLESLAPCAPPELPLAPGPRSLGRLRWRASGALAEDLGAAGQLEADLPITVSDFLAALAHQGPSARALIERALVHSQGRRLGAKDLLHEGAELDLVVLISGG